MEGFTLRVIENSGVQNERFGSSKEVCKIRWKFRGSK
jgi:hypothetical protein